MEETDCIKKDKKSMIDCLKDPVESDDCRAQRNAYTMCKVWTFNLSCVTWLLSGRGRVLRRNLWHERWSVTQTDTGRQWKDGISLELKLELTCCVQTTIPVSRKFISRFSVRLHSQLLHFDVCAAFSIEYAHSDSWRSDVLGCQGPSLLIITISVHSIRCL